MCLPGSTLVEDHERLWFQVTALVLLQATKRTDNKPAPHAPNHNVHSRQAITPPPLSKERLDKWLG